MVAILQADNLTFKLELGVFSMLWLWVATESYGEYGEYSINMIENVLGLKATIASYSPDEGTAL